MVSSFRGLNNVADPLRLDFGWLQTADNVEVTNTGALARREGYLRKVSGVPSGAYSTQDFTRLYWIDAGTLTRIMPDMSTVTLKSGLASARVTWAEINKRVFFTNGIDSGIIELDDSVSPLSWNTPSSPTLIALPGSLDGGTYQVQCTFVLPDGRETGSGDTAEITLTDGQMMQISDIPQQPGMTTNVYIAPANSAVFNLAFNTTLTANIWDSSPDNLGVELETQFLNPLPPGSYNPTFSNGSLYVMVHFTGDDETAIFWSKPLSFHLFGVSDAHLKVRGEGTMMFSVASGLVICTKTNIYHYDNREEVLTLLAEYGTPPGHGWDADTDGTFLFWTKRGLCRAMPFQNLTEKVLSVAPGINAGACIIKKNGSKKFVVALTHGDAAFNPANYQP